MFLLRGLLDRLILIVCVIAGGMAPSYLAQYRQHVGGALGQVLKDLAPFQQIADQFHGGSLARLIQHHLASPDNTFHAEGAAIQAMADSASALRTTMAALDTDVFHQSLYLMTHGDAAMARATWAAFHPSFGLTLDSLLMGAAFGLSIWLVFLLAWWTVSSLWSRWRNPRRLHPMRRGTR